MKKNRRKWFGMSPSRKFIFLLQMTFLVTGMLCCVNIRAWGQAEPKVTLKLEHVTFVRVIENLRKQTGYEFVFNAQDVEHVKDVSLSLRNVSLRVAMDSLVKGKGLTYSITGLTIVIKKQVIERKFIKVKGFVLDIEQRPLPGVTVKVVGLPIGTATDAKGWFALELPMEKGTLGFSFIGFKKQQIEFTEATDTLRIVLEEDISDLDEVQVIAYGERKKGK